MATRYLTSNYRAAGSYNAVRARSVDAAAVWALPGRLDTSLTGLRYMIGHDLDQTSMSCE